MTSASPEVLALLKRVYANNNSYFDDEGRYGHRIPATFTDEERQQLADAGLMPNQFVTLTHDEAIARLRTLAAQVDLRRAADAFVASMSDPQRLSWLTVLPAMALGRAMPEHAEEQMGGGSCRICFYKKDDSVDATLQAYFRMIQGAGWGSSTPVDAVLALEAALALDAQDWPRPTPRDCWVFHRVLERLRALPPDARYSVARKDLKDAKLLAVNNQYRCETLLEALGFIGVMAPAEHPGLFTRFGSAVEHDRRPGGNVEVSGPLAWWRASHGLNEDLLVKLFGHLEDPLYEPPEPEAAKPKKAAKPKAASGAKPKSIPGPPMAGDVYAVRYREDLWGAAYCHEVRADGRGRVEYLDFLSPMPPTVDQVQALAFRDRLNGERWQAWLRALDKTVGVKRIAINVNPPSHDQPIPDRLPFGSGSDLIYLAGWNFEEV